MAWRCRKNDVMAGLVPAISVEMPGTRPGMTSVPESVMPGRVPGPLAVTK